MKEEKEVKWTYAGVKDGKLYYFDGNEWRPANDDAGLTRAEVQEMIDENINDVLNESF